MAILSSRQDLIDYALRKLGDGVIKINVTDEQIDDCLDDALQYCEGYHTDFVEKAYLKYTITQDDYNRQYIILPDNVIGVNKLFPFPYGKGGPFDPKYHLALTDLYYYGSLDMVGYTMTKSYMSMVGQLLNPNKTVRFKRFTGKLHIETSWPEYLQVGTLIIMDATIAISAEDNEKVYNDMRLKELFTAMLKLQWAQNMSKFNDIKLIGGTTLNARDMKAEAKTEVDEIKALIREENELPLPPMFG